MLTTEQERRLDRLMAAEYALTKPERAELKKLLRISRAGNAGANSDQKGENFPERGIQ